MKSSYFKNKTIYYGVIFTSLLLIIGPYIYQMMHTLWFVVLITLHTFVLRPWVDKQRMKALGLYENEGYWKFFWVTRLKHFGVLMLGGDSTDTNSSN